MNNSQKNSDEVIRYLFNEIADAERDALEERIFADEDFGLFVESAENDLVDEYLRGEMNSAKKQRFETNYASSAARREKIRAASVLHEKLFAEKEPVTAVNSAAKVSIWQNFAEFFRAPKLTWAGGLALILVAVLIGGWLLLRQTANRTELVKEDNSNRQTQIPAPQISPKNDFPENANKPENNANISVKNAINGEKKTLPTNEKPEKNEETAPPQPRVFAVTLLPMLRSSDKTVLSVPKNSETVLLRVVHDNQKNFAKYRAQISSQNGSVIFNRDFSINEKNLARPLALTVKNSALNAGSYELTLTGITKENQSEEIKFYNFTVVQK